MTVLKNCEKRYPGLGSLYANLSESAHPNYVGLCVGYSTINHEDFETTFSNRWTELHGAEHGKLIMLCMATFRREYDNVWTDLFAELEEWIVANDEELEATKKDPIGSH